MTVAVGDRDDHPAVLQWGGRDGVLVGDARHAVRRAALGGDEGPPSAPAVRCGLPGLARRQPGIWYGHLGHRIGASGLRNLFSGAVSVTPTPSVSGAHVTGRCMPGVAS